MKICPNDTFSSRKQHTMFVPSACWSDAFPALVQHWTLRGFRDRPNVRVTLLVHFHNRFNAVLCSANCVSTSEHIGTVTPPVSDLCLKHKDARALKPASDKKHKRLTRPVVKREIFRHQRPTGQNNRDSSVKLYNLKTESMPRGGLHAVVRLVLAKHSPNGSWHRQYWSQAYRIALSSFLWITHSL